MLNPQSTFNLQLEVQNERAHQSTLLCMAASHLFWCKNRGLLTPSRTVALSLMFENGFQGLGLHWPAWWLMGSGPPFTDLRCPQVVILCVTAHRGAFPQHRPYVACATASRRPRCTKPEHDPSSRTSLQPVVSSPTSSLTSSGIHPCLSNSS